MRNSRQLFITHRDAVSFRFTTPARKAILQGDLSGKAIHPFFVHYGAMAGSNLYQEYHRDYSLMHILEQHLESACREMARMKEETNPLAFAQAHHLMSLACSYNQNVTLAERFLEKAIDIVQRNDIRFVPNKKGPLPGLTEEVHERVSFLCELIYSEIQMRIMTGKVGEFCVQLHKQFREDLPVRVFRLNHTVANSWPNSRHIRRSSECAQ